MTPPTRSPTSARWLAGIAAATTLSAAAAVLNYRRARQAERRNPPVGDFIDTDGARLHYLRQGTGPSLAYFEKERDRLDRALAQVGSRTPPEEVEIASLHQQRRIVDEQLARWTRDLV